MSDHVPTPLIEAMANGILQRGDFSTESVAEETLAALINHASSNPESREWLLEQIGMESHAVVVYSDSKATQLDGLYRFKENTNE